MNLLSDSNRLVGFWAPRIATNTRYKAIECGYKPIFAKLVDFDVYCVKFICIL